MKVAVTGATGFIGRHVLSQLGMSSVLHSAITVSDTENPEHPECEIVHLDLHNPPSNILQLLGYPDVVIHLAWSGLPNYKSLHHFEQNCQRSISSSGV